MHLRRIKLQLKLTYAIVAAVFLYFTVIFTAKYYGRELQEVFSFTQHSVQVAPKPHNSSPNNKKSRSGGYRGAQDIVSSKGYYKKLCELDR